MLNMGGHIVHTFHCTSTEVLEGSKVLIRCVLCLLIGRSFHIVKPIWRHGDGKRTPSRSSHVLRISIGLYLRTILIKSQAPQKSHPT